MSRLLFSQKQNNNNNEKKNTNKITTTIIIIIIIINKEKMSYASNFAQRLFKKVYLCLQTEISEHFIACTRSFGTSQFLTILVLSLNQSILLPIELSKNTE